MPKGIVTASGRNNEEKDVKIKKLLTIMKRNT